MLLMKQQIDIYLQYGNCNNISKYGFSSISGYVVDYKEDNTDKYNHLQSYKIMNLIPIYKQCTNSLLLYILYYQQIIIIIIKRRRRRNFSRFRNCLLLSSNLKKYQTYLNEKEKKKDKQNFWMGFKFSYYLFNIVLPYKKKEKTNLD